MPNVSVAGLRAATNQSLTNAAPTPADASTATVVAAVQRAGIPGASPPARKPGSVKKKSASSTPAQMRLNPFECAAAGAWSSCASAGTDRIAAARSVSVAIIRARGELNVCVPCFAPPTTKAIPRTSTLLAMTEPTRADWTTRVRPSWSAKSAMKSSGRFPSADWITPATEEPKRAPSCSVAPPTSRASTAIASASSSHEPIRQAPGWAASLLSGRQIEVARHFARSGIPPVAMWVGVDVRDGSRGPLVEGALGWLECRTVSEHEAGDHTIFVGEVESIELGAGGEGLVYRGGEYHPA